MSSTSPNDTGARQTPPQTPVRVFPISMDSRWILTSALAKNRPRTKPALLSPSSPPLMPLFSSHSAHLQVSVRSASPQQATMLAGPTMLNYCDGKTRLPPTRTSSIGVELLRRTMHTRWPRHHRGINPMVKHQSLRFLSQELSNSERG